MRYVSLIGKWMAGVILVSMLTVFTTATMVGMVIDRIMQQFNLPFQTPDLSVSAVVGQMLFGGGKANPEAGSGLQERKSAQSGTGGDSRSGISGQPGGSGEGTGTSPGTEGATGSTGGGGLGESGGTGSAGSDRTPGDSLPVWNGSGSGLPGIGRDGAAESGSGTGDGSKEGTGGNLVMSADEFAQKKDNLSEKDKSTIFSLLVTKLPQNDLQQLLGFVENGITQEELDEINEIVERNLSSDEYQELIDIISKY